MQAFLGGVVALVLPLSSIPLTPASQPAAAVNAATPVSEIVQPLTATSTAPEEVTAPRTATVDTVSDNDADLRAEIALLGSGISALTALLTERPSATVPPDFSPFQSQLDALQLAMARSTRIDQLSNVTISSPTFTNLTTGSVSEGSNLYYTDSRVGSYISASTTIPHIGGTAYGDLPYWTGSIWSTIATSSLGLTPAWGSITGTLSNQTDLQTALDAKLSLTNWFATTTAPHLTTLANLATIGTLTSGIWNASTIGVPYGGTGWGNISAGAIPYGNGASALATTTAGTAGNILAYLNGIPTWTATTTFAAPLTYANGAVSIAAANGTTNGYLASADWTTFNTKQDALSWTYPLINTANTISLGFGTTTTNTWSQTQTFTTGLLSLASSTIGDGTQTGGLTVSGGATTTGNLVVQGSATSTFSAGLQTAALNVTTGTSTFANGIALTGGCVLFNGTCLGGSSAAS